MCLNSPRRSLLMSRIIVSALTIPLRWSTHPLSDGFYRQPAHLSQTNAGRAAGLARAAMIFRQRLKQGLIIPDGTKDGPHCMDTYRWMFDCCRVPGLQGKDWSVTYAKEGDQGHSGHITVIRNNRVWKLDATKDGKILSLADFEK